jgi:pimeloyl-ACP methyl ester carboxylesterase
MLSVLLGSVSSCAIVKVNTMKPADFIALQRGDVLSAGKLSSASLDSLKVVDLDDSSCRKKINDCLNAVKNTSGLTDEQRLSTLAEVWILAATTSPARDPKTGNTDQSIAEWLEAARYAYGYLFFTTRQPGERAFEDRQTQVRDYYNYAVQQSMTLLFDRQKAAYGSDPSWVAQPIQIGKWTIEMDVSNLKSVSRMPDEVIPAGTLRFNGLRSVYRRDGFGAELVAVLPQKPLGESDLTRLANALKPQPTTPPKVYSEMPSPAISVLYRFSGETLTQLLNTDHVQLSAYDPYLKTNVMIRDQKVPLAANFTAGYGLWLARSSFATQSIRSLFGRSEGITSPQVYLMQPFDPNRRIIVMLHGLASSPEAWVNVANEVLGDDSLRQHYQVWQVYYPTNAPIAYNRTQIRDALDQTVKRFDPSGTSVAANNMVLIGHSMGGVISRLLVSSAKDQLWNMVTEKRKFTPEQMTKLHDGLNAMLRFEPMPNVHRVIFIAAPHRGTPFASNTIGRWVGNLIKLPLNFVEKFGDVAKILTAGEPGTASKDRTIPNSIDNLKDSDPFVRAAAKLPISPQVKYHSIIAQRNAKVPLLKSDDGVVPYTSSHLDGALSEKVIISTHSVQDTPQSILEIRRILHEDLGDMDKVGFERSGAVAH